MNLLASRSLQHFVVTHEDGEYVCLLTFRDLMALAACRQGRARWRERRTHSPWVSYVGVWPEVDDFGVGFGTVLGLAHRWPEGSELIVNADEPGPCILTDRGNAALDAVLALPGVELVTDALSAKSE